MKKIRTAIIGTGFMGRVHLQALRRTEGIEIAAMVGREAESAQKIARGFDVPSTTDLPRVLEDPSIDAVHLCTPNASHYALSLLALKEGKHVLARSHFPYPHPKLRNWSASRLIGDYGTASVITCATIHWCSRCAQCERAENLGKSLSPKAPTRRTRYSTTLTGTGESIQPWATHFAPWLISEHTGSTW
jgi:hypothetical protein